ncbi:hypothetical protein [Cellulophaga fucicola]|uniref:CDP-Glycerol:Poly(Glycerophosphate) glycerophosphotransferase n=1 Tax=Cellulophaga fucicola TaxID=76595 RepID=A0A1K1Q9L4_9FLAO|nr:hypothetical protein [Cellulophaga fucicola]SFW56607.1 hypothetical protein SAMN05660313_02498 [Cellulophaga fucicola]
MNKKILFFPQNNEHVLNMNPVLEELQKSDFKCEYLDTRAVYKQKLEFNSGCNFSKVFFPELENSFYHLSSIDRIIYIRSVRKVIKSLADEYDLFVFGNDGALQRLVNYYAKKQDKPSVMILDGLVGANKYSYSDVLFQSKEKIKDVKIKAIDSFKYFISKLFSGSSISPYLPSTIGSSNLNEIYTIGDFSKSYIENHKHKTTKVFSFGLPRMRQHFLENETFFIPKKPKSICFITSAYKWHNLDHFHDSQIQDILLIQECINEIYPKDDEIKLYVKLHPRERMEDYDLFKNSKRIQLVVGEPLVETFKNYKLLFSNISTCIVEGVNKGVKVHSILINFPYWKFKNGFLKEPSISKIFTKNELSFRIKNELEEDKVVYDIPVENKFLSAETQNSVKNISESIKKLT